MQRLSILCLSFLMLATLPGAGTSAAAGGADQPQIVMYVMPQCSYCERARNYLQQRGYRWREVDIAASAQAKDEFDARGGVGTPLIVIGEDQVTGFNVARLQQLLQPSS